MSDVKTCLWFEHQAEEAANLYVSLVPDSRIGGVMRGAPDTPAIAVGFTLAGREYLALNGRRTNGFSDACSLMISCDTQADIDRYWSALSDGGEEGQCGWLKDRFGVSWQIVPNDMPRLLGGSDPAASGRAMQAMLAMKKLDIAALERARAG